MSKPYTEADFSAQITEDRNWRIKEVSDLKAAVRRGDETLQRVLLRALVTICYAHWEGYVRFSARKYLEHIALRRFRYEELNTQFFRNYFLPRLAALATTKTSISERCNLVDEILNSSTRSFSRVNEDLINTKANLNFDVLTDICLVCGVPVQLFADRSTFIDLVLLKRRNAIAHGEDSGHSRPVPAREERAVRYVKCSLNEPVVLHPHGAAPRSETPGDPARPECLGSRDNQRVVTSSSINNSFALWRCRAAYGEASLGSSMAILG